MAEYHRTGTIVKAGYAPEVIIVEWPERIWKFTYLNYLLNLLQFDLSSAVSTE